VGVKRPDWVRVPAAEVAGLQVTAVLSAFATVAVNCCVAVLRIVVGVGVRLTVTLLAMATGTLTVEDQLVLWQLSALRTIFPAVLMVDGAR
jgi:hypothetical protein